MKSLFKRAASFVNDWKAPSDTLTGVGLGVSVVVPVYRPYQLPQFIDHLLQVDGVNEVILVDDSGDRDDRLFAAVRENLNIVPLRHEKNLGRSAARNTGAAHATGDVLLFADQDMFLAPDLIPTVQATIAANGGHAVALGLRGTVPFSSIPLASDWVGLDPSVDWRRRTVVADEFIDLTAAGVGSPTNRCEPGRVLRLYEDTSALRELGVAPETTLGFWDLPSVVISHSMAISRDDFYRIGGFPEWIRGWGGEDIVVGFSAVACRIPIVLSDIVSYQAAHLPYSGSEEEKLAELVLNINKYRQWAQRASALASPDARTWFTRGTRC